MRNPEAWRRPWPDLYAECLDFVGWAETLGFDQAWFSEHHGADDGYLPSPLTMSAAAAARTKTMRIATGIALAPFYHPVRLAEDVAVIDVISNGRFELSLGLGYLRREFEAYGVEAASRGRRANELLQIIRPLWTGETVNFKGEFYEVKNARIYPLPVQRPGVPVYIGAAARPGLRRAARYGDGFIGQIENYPAYLEEVRACGKKDGDARFTLLSASDSWIVVADDPDKAMAEVAPHAHYQYSVYAKWMEEGDYNMPKMDLETFKKSGLFKALTPDEAIDFIRSKMKIAPIESYCMQAPAGLPMAEFSKYAELFANKVLPAFR